jgi:hypothetical protein
MDPAFFTVRTPRARTHQQQLACIHHIFMTMPAPIAHATRSDKRPPICMVSSAETWVFAELTVVLVFPLVFYFKFFVGISIINIFRGMRAAAGERASCRRPTQAQPQGPETAGKNLTGKSL